MFLSLHQKHVFRFGEVMCATGGSSSSKGESVDPPSTISHRRIRRTIRVSKRSAPRNKRTGRGVLLPPILAVRLEEGLFLHDTACVKGSALEQRYIPCQNNRTGQTNRPFSRSSGSDFFMCSPRNMSYGSRSQVAVAIFDGHCFLLVIKFYDDAKDFFIVKHQSNV